MHVITGVKINKLLPELQPGFIFGRFQPGFNSQGNASCKQVRWVLRRLRGNFFVKKAGQHNPVITAFILHHE
jgi:hypothetical protein